MRLPKNNYTNVLTAASYSISGPHYIQLHTSMKKNFEMSQKGVIQKSKIPRYKVKVTKGASVSKFKKLTNTKLSTNQMKCW